MTAGICYVGFSPHFIHLAAVSAYTLRKQHYDGPITILTDVPNYLPALERDGGVTCTMSPIPHRRAVRAPAYYIKSLLPEISPYESTLFLDADTLVDGDISPLLQAESSDAILLAKHPDGRVQDSGRAKQRLESLVERGQLHPSRLKLFITQNAWAINSGMISFTRKLRMPSKRWQDTTLLLDNHVLHDELALQIIYPDYPHVLVGTEYNRLINREPTAKTAIVWHYTNKYIGLGRAAALYCETLTEMWDKDWAGCRGWYEGDIDMLRPFTG